MQQSPLQNFKDILPLNSYTDVSRASPTVGYAPIIEGKLYCELSGQGEPVVFIHGMTLDTRMWSEQIPYFSKSFLTINYDARGFGKSSDPTTTPYHHADDLKALLDYLGISKASLVGLSLGGDTALQFAMKYPESVTSLVLVDSGLINFSFPMLSSVLKRANELGEEGKIEEAKSAWANDALFGAAHEQPKVSEAIKEMVRDYSGWHWLNQQPVFFPLPKDQFNFKNIMAKTLIVLGERDTQDFHTIASILLNNITGAELFTIPGVGHMSNMEAPNVFNQVVHNFLSACNT